jgi:mRNA-decapping enzyme subunit 2
MNWQQELLNQATTAAKAAAKPKGGKVRPRDRDRGSISRAIALGIPPRRVLLAVRPTFLADQAAGRVSFLPLLSQASKASKKVVPPPPAPVSVKTVKTKKGTVKLNAAALNAANVPGADLLEELAARFILNCPEEELNNFERIMFLVEQAHWYYEDFVREEKPHLRGMKLREFAELMFNKCASLRRYRGKVDEIYKKFTAYKFSVPTGGLIVLNPKLDKCVMVKGYKSGSSWGFPKGKINKDEPEMECAVREVLEEVGVDFTGLTREEDSIVINRVVDKESGLKQRSRLFIVPGIAEETHFATQTRKEISKIAWHPVASLVKEEGKKYFFVKPFVQPLLKWIKAAKKRFAAGGAAGAGGYYGSGAIPAGAHPLVPPSPGAGVGAAAPVYLSDIEAAATARFPTFANFAFDRERVKAAMAKAR